MEIDDLIKSNVETIRELYNHFLDPSIDPLTQRPFSFMTLKACLPMAAYLDMTEEEISIAYAFSKKVQENEIG